MENPETLSTLITQDTEEINVRKKRMGNKEYVYLSFVLCMQCWQCFWIVHSWWPPRFSLIITYPVSCVLNVDSAFGLSLRFSLTFICPVSCVFNVESERYCQH
jgi:hypothetical protein